MNYTSISSHPFQAPATFSVIALRDGFFSGYTSLSVHPSLSGTCSILHDPTPPVTSFHLLIFVPPGAGCGDAVLHRRQDQQMSRFPTAFLSSLGEHFAMSETSLRTPRLNRSTHDIAVGRQYCTRPFKMDVKHGILGTHEPFQPCLSDLPKDYTSRAL